MSSETIPSFEPPVLLAAMPQIVDPFFNRSVVLLVEHQSEGSLGFIVNRPTGLLVGEVLDGLAIEWRGRAERYTYFGGPVQPQLGTILFEEGAVELDDPDESTVIAAPGIRLSQNIGILERIAHDPPESFRLILGYAGWGEGQLEEELRRNDWLIIPVDTDLVFSRDTDSIWKRTLASIGVDPGLLPSWTRESDPGQAN